MNTLVHDRQVAQDATLATLFHLYGQVETHWMPDANGQWLRVWFVFPEGTTRWVTWLVGAYQGRAYTYKGQRAWEATASQALKTLETLQPWLVWPEDRKRIAGAIKAWNEARVRSATRPKPAQPRKSRPTASTPV